MRLQTAVFCYSMSLTTYFCAMNTNPLNNLNYEENFNFLMMLFCFGTALCLDANAKGRKQATTTTVYVEKKKGIKPARSLQTPILGILTPDGNRLVLNSPEDCDAAYVVISGGNGEFLGDLVNFDNHTVEIDTSELGVGNYGISVEFENGAIYTGAFQFITD